MANPPKKSTDRRAFLGRFFDSVNESAWGSKKGGYDPKAIAKAVKRLSRFFGKGRYFRVATSGWEKVPEAPVLLVANHSGGTSIPDAWGLGYCWYKMLGFERPVHPLAHDMVFALKATAKPFSELGVLRANPGVALEALTEWKRDIVVMPGGDVETWRPYKDRFTVRWAGRTGYAKLALKAGVPIVPVACAGAHSTLMVLTDGRRFARRIGLHKIARSDVFPVHLSLPWGLGIGPLPHLPLPARFRFLVGDPIYPLNGVADGSAAETAVELDARVRERMQVLLNELRDGALKSGHEI